MSGIGQQLPALVGVVIGAGASYLAGAASERTRWRRERSSRWDERRAQAYADYGYAVKNVYVTSTRAAELRQQGHPDTIAAARTWHRRVWQVERFARGQRTDTGQWDAVHDDINADRDRFYAAARQDLGITTGDVPRSERWEVADAESGQGRRGLQ